PDARRGGGAGDHRAGRTPAASRRGGPGGRARLWRHRRDRGPRDRSAACHHGPAPACLTTRGRRFLHYSGVMAYPAAHRLDLVDVLHGVEVADPYRWLEDPEEPETKAWSGAQDELARTTLDRLPGREAFRERLRELLAAGLVTVPEVRGRRAFFTRGAPAQGG